MSRMRSSRPRSAPPGRGRFLRTLVVSVLAVALAATSVGPALRAQQQIAAGGQISAEAMAQINALLREKQQRTPVERKIDSHILYDLRVARGQPIAGDIWTLENDLPYVDSERVSVDVSLQVTAQTLQELQTLGAEIVSFDPTARAVRLRATLDQIEAIAALPSVRFVQPEQQAIVNTGTVNSEG